MNEFFHEARNKGVGVFARSIYLRGLLTRQVHTVPARLGPLKDAALNALAIAGAEVQSLSELAIRFCLSFDIINSVLIGVTDSAELKSNLADAEKGPLPDQLLSKLKVTSFGQDPIVDTRTWQDVIV
jgi:aryl-alcohol dehydrogenase-like predicted oxidoreductase